MPGPLHWFRNPRKLSDEELVNRTVLVMVQLRNRTWLEDEPTRTFLEASLLTHIREIENRISQGRLFD